LIYGGNDCLYFSPEEYKENFIKLLGKMKERLPDCRMVTITIPPSGLYKGIANGKKYETEEAWNENIQRYNSVMVEVSKKYGAKTSGGQALCSYRIRFGFPEDYDGVLSYLKDSQIKLEGIDI
jgi:hypothetical protein